MRVATQMILAGLVASLIAWDLIAYFTSGPSATVSTVLLDWASDHPVIVFIAGGLCGHIFWPQYRDRRKANRISLPFENTPQ